MKKLTIIFYLFLIPLCVFAQNESSISHTKTVNDSTLIKIHAIVEDIDFRMHGLDRYKLYPTENIRNFGILFLVPYTKDFRRITQF